jgi:hypothetical protein
LSWLLFRWVCNSCFVRDSNSVMFARVRWCSHNLSFEMADTYYIENNIIRVIPLNPCILTWSSSKFMQIWFCCETCHANTRFCCEIHCSDVLRGGGARFIFTLHSCARGEQVHLVSKNAYSQDARIKKQFPNMRESKKRTRESKDLMPPTHQKASVW